MKKILTRAVQVSRTCLFLVPVLVYADEVPSIQRAKFVAAEKALQQSQISTYERIKHQLEEDHYVLVPYLEYAEIQRDLSKGLLPTEQVHAFLEQENDTALGSRMRSVWLNYLAKKGQWDLLAKDYVASNDPSQQCQDIYARYKTTNNASILNEALPLWLYGKSRPDACNTVFKTWRAKGGLSEKLVWDRVYLAMEANQYSVVNYLVRYVPESKRHLIQAWLTTYKDPKIITSDKLFQGKASFLRDVQIYGLKRIARKDPDKAVTIWHKLEKKYSFSETQHYHAYRAIALGMAMDHDPEALRWYKKIPLAHYDNSSYEWHVRAALRAGDWKEVAQIIPKFPPALREDSVWDYWLARAYEHTGKKSEAASLYKELSQERSFGGIFASERLGVKYPINLPAHPLSDSDIEATLHNKGIARALELHEMGRTTQARREWLDTLSLLNETQLQAAAVIAFEQGWQDRAILTLARAKNQNNLAVRFPVLYRKTIEQEAKRNGLSPAWVFAIARRESAFIPDVKSPVGATGLMQLMPYTAKQVARQIKEPYHSPSQLTNAGLNVRLGSAYLKSIYRDLDNNMILATAAYNAGPHRVKQWLPKSGSIPTDIWIETVPFTETREYVKAVLIYGLIYQHHLKMEQSLGDVLGEIKA